MSDEHSEIFRKNPTQPRAKRTVSTIFEATAQILRDEGEKALTTNRVAERAGFSIGTLYQYFPSMDAILLAMIAAERERVIAEQAAFIAEGEASDEDPVALVRRFIHALVQSYGIAPRVFRPLLKRGWRLDHMPQVMASVQDMAERIRQAMTRRNHPDFPAPTAAELFVATRAVLGAIRAAVLEDSDLAAEPEFEEALVRLAVGQLRRKT
jgi:AcrR family transcriptional regulator